MRSSSGFHTMTLSNYLLETDKLLEDFKEYSRKTHSIQIYPDKSGHTVIKFFPIDKGIKWSICRDVWLNNINCTVDILKVTINPKILAGIHDYITAATYDDMDAAINKFDTISQEISPLLDVFDCYDIKRIDYCINFSVNELAPRCTPEQIMTLIRRADIPPHYTEWDEYNHVAHRTKSSPDSFYLMASSVTVNCYDKHAKLQKQSQKNEERGYPPIPQATLDAAKGIIRFEVQCKYHKMYGLNKKAAGAGDRNANKYESLLTHTACIDIIGDYFSRVVGKGDWHTLHDAIRIIESQHFNKQKEKRLIDALRLVNDCRSIAKAKKAFKDDELKNFKKTLKDLSSLNINPVTIPKWWGIKHIPNLLYAYSDKSQEETSRKKREEFMMECVEEYFHK